MNNRLKSNDDILQAPFIKVQATITQAGTTNGKPNIKQINKYIIAPSGKKIATYIVNQIFGSELLTQTEGLNINWLMPSLKGALESAVYQEESFIYIHKYNNKVYLENIDKNKIHDLEQQYDDIKRCTIIQEYETDNGNFELHRHIEMVGNISYLNFEAFEVSKNSRLIPIELATFNYKAGTDYQTKYVLPYRVLINIDIGQDFFKDSRKFLNEEMEIFNTLVDEIEKTKTRIVTSQHYQSGDVVANWQPASNHYKIDTLTVGKLADYFTLLPGDKDHQLFEFLQGDIRYDAYISSFKFCDYQVIQMAGLSPASFGYEKDAYQNKDSIDLSKNNSDMTIEAIKNQIEPQINDLIANVVRCQTSQGLTENLIPTDLQWNYGNNEKLTDMKKLQVLNRIQSVMSIPYSIRAKIVTPIINKLIDEGVDQATIDKIIEENQKEQKGLTIEYGEI